MSSLGIKGNFYHWIKGFLSKRTEIVELEDAKSDPCAMTSGVPQGSCLRPLLFNAFVNDIDDCLTFSNILKYADDSKIYCSCVPPEKEICADHLQTDLNSLSAWSGDWQLKFNASKCSSLHFGHGNVPHLYFVSGQPITSNNCERDLSVLISNNLKPSSHIPQIVKCTEMCLAVLRGTIVSPDKAIFWKLYKQLVRPHL